MNFSPGGAGGVLAALWCPPMADSGTASVSQSLWETLQASLGASFTLNV